MRTLLQIFQPNASTPAEVRRVIGFRIFQEEDKTKPSTVGFAINLADADAARKANPKLAFEKVDLLVVKTSETFLIPLSEVHRSSLTEEKEEEARRVALSKLTWEDRQLLGLQ